MTTPLPEEPNMTTDTTQPVQDMRKPTTPERDAMIKKIVADHRELLDSLAKQ